jgi:Na+/H+ antiporter NhaC
MFSFSRVFSLLVGAFALHVNGQVPIVLDNAGVTLPVAVYKEDFSFDVDVSFLPPLSLTGTELLFWRVRRDTNTIGSGFVNITTDEGSLISTFGADLSDDYVGKNRYIIEASLNQTFPSAEVAKESILVKLVPGPVTLLPPLVTVFVAAYTKNVLLSLFSGIYFAALIIWNYNPFYAFINLFSNLIIYSFSDRDHIFIIVFTWILSGMITCVLKAGGGEGLVKEMSRYAKTPRGGMVVAYILGLLIFFDDYANTLIVGQTIRPITDSLGVSRERLAFLVDATAAPVASVSPISSWIGFELSLIQSVLDSLTEAGEDLSCYESSAFLIFLQTIPSRFYPFLMLGTQLFLIVMGREFGSMLTYERAARVAFYGRKNDAEDVEKDQAHMTPLAEETAVELETETETKLDTEIDRERHIEERVSENFDRISFGSLSHHAIDLAEFDKDGDKKEEEFVMDANAQLLEPSADTPRRWWNCVLPIIVVITVVLLSLVFTGLTGIRHANDAYTVQNIFSYSDSFTALLYGSVFGTITIWSMCWFQRITSDGRLTTVLSAEGRQESSKPLMSLNESLDIFILGIKNLVDAILILILAWTVGDAFTKCGTGIYISSALSDNLDPGAYPAVTFVISGILALVTGSSWGTMSIMFPLILPAAHYADPCNTRVFYGTISSILAGAVFGDHCSPISDTTVLSAVACRCPLINHVKSQFPYALLVGTIGVLVGDLPTGKKFAFMLILL